MKPRVDTGHGDLTKYGIEAHKQLVEPNCINCDYGIMDYPLQGMFSCIRNKTCKEESIDIYNFRDVHSCFHRDDKGDEV